MVVSVGKYFFQNEMISGAFEAFGYPTYLVYPLGVIKLIGVAVLWIKPNPRLVDFAYAGFLFNFILAFFAHYMISDGQYAPPIISLILWTLSFVSYTKVYLK
jgi:hypothetical protein